MPVRVRIDRTRVRGHGAEVGDPAPDFALKASNGKTYKVSYFRNKQAIVLAWFPKAYTRGCTLECKSLAEHGDLLAKYDVAYFMISVIGKDGHILSIDKDVKPATSAEDMAAKLHELGVGTHAP